MITDAIQITIISMKGKKRSPISKAGPKWNGVKGNKDTTNNYFNHN